MSNGMLDGKRAIVTGASRGIGAAVAQRFAAEGARVALVARTRETHAELAGSLSETMAKCQTHGAEVAVIQADLADVESRSTVVDQAVRLLGGPVDILVNNAAASVYEPVAHYPLASRRTMFEVNLHAPVDLIQAALPEMISQGSGWVVNVSSSTADYDRGTDGQAPGPGGLSSTLAVYAASKAALNRLSYALAQELRGTGVRVNCVLPRSAVLTEGMAALLGPNPDPKHLEPLETMAEAILWLSRCPEETTGGTFRSLALLEAMGTEVMSLDGKNNMSRTWHQ
ncbi:MAG: SDR family NAD(P)-dependent oxidoreductase [Acidimicrobiales bacterium]